MKKLLRWFSKILCTFFLAVLVALGGAAVLQVRIDLTAIKAPIERLAGKAVGRPVVIEKSIALKTSLQPTFMVEGLKIGNHRSFQHQYFLSLETAAIQIDLLQLFLGKIHIEHLRIDKLEITLEKDSEGTGNWVAVSRYPGRTGEEQTAPATAKEEAAERRLASDSIVVKDLDVSESRLRYFTVPEAEPQIFTLHRCRGEMLPGAPLLLDINGSLLDHAIDLSLSISSLQEFLSSNRSWMGIEVKLAETLFTFSGEVDLAHLNQSFSLEAGVSGANLSSLNNLLLLNLPPLKEYTANALMIFKKDRLELQNLLVATGRSELRGTAFFVRENDKYISDISFSSPLIQIDDFLLEEWQWRNEPEKKIHSQHSPATGDDVHNNGSPLENPQPGAEESRNVRAVTDPEVLAKLDATLTIQIQQVQSGSDSLGSGLLKMSLQDRRLTLDPLELNIPGGSLHLAVSIKPGTPATDASFRAFMHNFDIGIIARQRNPESKMGGLVNLDIDLSTTASNLDQIFTNGTGYFDFSGQLENIETGLIDLWAMNLVTVILSKISRDTSMINCAVGRWKVEEGVLAPQVFFIDTSKIRICGKGSVDFKNREVNLYVRPKAKKAEFFSLATPLRIRGKFENLNIGLSGEGIIGTAVSFITSPVHVPVRRLVSSGLPRNGRDVCTMSIGPDNRDQVSVAGCSSP
ncbi:MAG: AsmA family protein [Desulfopila sp.]|jgi:uncharacterized protein involved in outer membrane biogenesis|nr:AsmA family protein [Desulfopila sp.]